jgi:hypothetical protein
MRFTASLIAVLSLAACAVPRETAGDPRKVRHGFFYDVFTPPPDEDKAAMQRRLEKQGAMSPLPPFGEVRLPPRQSHGANADNPELSDWRDAVLANADASLLRQMRATSAARVAALEGRIASFEKTPYAMRPGRAEELRHELDLERRKLSEIEFRLGGE